MVGSPERKARRMSRDSSPMVSRLSTLAREGVKTPLSPRKGMITKTTNSIAAHSGKEESGSLMLADGSEYKGYSFGADRSISGEVVFNTGMVGYPEALTDPSYRGQILVLTYPMIGNYGVPDTKKMDALGLPEHFESNTIHIRGLIVMDYSHEHNHWNSMSSLGDWLKRHNVPALYGLDTRLLTKKIRESGVILGKIQFPKHKTIALEDPNKLNLVDEVSTKKVTVYGKGNSPKILGFDCGIKYNIIRFLVNRGVELTVVPFDYDLKNSDLQYDGVFISNGPGDPTMASATVNSIKWALTQDKPIFGICLGNQILALAAGAKTYKMKYGNRGMNQPCIDLRDGRCYITPQNHGFAVDNDSLPADWKPLFMNANDGTNEGLIHTSKPFMSVQFHPEANGGPLDTAFLFDHFLQQARGEVVPKQLLPMHRYESIFKRPIEKVLLVGSGGLSIGQAGEFDYSGSQAIKALKEEGIEVILINPNIATVQTSKGFADKVYFLPVTPEFVEQIIKKERPDSIVVSMGGQTALACGMKLEKAGVFAKYNVRVLGTQISVVEMTEDRDAFSKQLAMINESAALSYSAESMEDAYAAAHKIGFPVLVRAAFTLGGLGSGFAKNDEELAVLLKKAFSNSPQVMIDQDLRGWKEVEYEVVRDINNNCITVCNMENFDPLGIHTGDSIVVAPSQTLSNKEYMMLRAVSLKVVRHLGVVGECNIQFALDPKSERYCIIEVNARLSRSSALASKATGYPLAYIAAKLALGKDLVKIRNTVTRNTTACFEPSLDYCVVKMPRWDLKKFEHVSQSIGSAMKSVGEVMAIGRNFEETFQKALRMVDSQSQGFGHITGLIGDKCATMSVDDIKAALESPDPNRVHYIGRAFQLGMSVQDVFDHTKIDHWFLHKLYNVHTLAQKIKVKNLQSLTSSEMQTLKCAGFSDAMIADLVNESVSGMDVRRRRIAQGVKPVVKQIDTLAAEFPAQTNYLYVTYNGSEHDMSHATHGVMVLGCGAYCIGSSVEFDWCAVNCVRELRKQKVPAIVVNYNPETVSTDYDESDRLYFEELSLERVLDIYELERSNGIVVSVGGQIPNNMANKLDDYGAKVLGTSPAMIDRAEDRNKFSSMLDEINVDQPSWAELKDMNSAAEFCKKTGFPVLVRPSYVLSGAAMRVCSSLEEVKKFVQSAGVSNDYPVVITQFIENAKEIEFDGVAQRGRIINFAISEHVENAGVHSGDASLLLPAQKLYTQTKRQAIRIANKIAAALDISGPFNIQMMAKDNDLKVIECNLRSSRTFPFISKTFDFNFIECATKIMLGINVKRHPINENELDFVACKAPMFSFSRLQGADPHLGVEMSSTGEVACFGRNTQEAFILSLLASGFKLKKNGNKNVLLSCGRDMPGFVEGAKTLQGLGYNVFATSGTAKYLSDRGVNVTMLHKPSSKKSPNVLDYINKRNFDIAMVVAKDQNAKDRSDGYTMRRQCVDFEIPLVTNSKCALLLISALQSQKEQLENVFDVFPISAFYDRKI